MSGVFDFMKAQTVVNGLASEGGSGTIWMFIYMSVTQFIFDVLRQFADTLKVVVQAALQRLVDKGKAKVATPLTHLTTAQEDPSRVVHTYTRPFGTNIRSAEYVQADAILHDVTSRPDVRRLLINGDLTTLNTDEEVAVKDGIRFRQLRVAYTDDDKLTNITFELSRSGPGSAQILLQYEQGVHQEFTVNRQNSFDTRVYYFDEFMEPEMRVLRADGTIGTRARDTIHFTKHEFVTGRTFDNMFFHQDNVVRDRFRFFLNNRSWYDSVGQPYHLGILMHGPPGCGKTSAIKAIANESNRHILNINLSRLHSKKLLKQLFYDPMLEIVKANSRGSTVESVYVPIEKRLFVIEDADCLLASVLAKRGGGAGTEGATTSTGTAGTDLEGVDEAFPDESADMGDASDMLLFGATPMGPQLQTGPQPVTPREAAAASPVDEDELDLSTILNILDGVLETPGRIIVLTTNHPEQFDDALLRPGRIDMIVNFRKCNADMLVRMARLYYGDDAGLDEEGMRAAAEAVPDGKWSPAEVTSLLLRHFNDRAGVWATLRDADPVALFSGW